MLTKGTYIHSVVYYRRRPLLDWEGENSGLVKGGSLDPSSTHRHTPYWLKILCASNIERTVREENMRDVAEGGGSVYILWWFQAGYSLFFSLSIHRKSSFLFFCPCRVQEKGEEEVLACSLPYILAPSCLWPARRLGVGQSFDFPVDRPLLLFNRLYRV
jgi:hypothetical protein